jgi:enamine deaminase RidA (YjgF/YER057c/UK114 family)
MPEIQRLGVTKRWSDAVIHNHVAYFVEVPDDFGLDARGQIAQVLELATKRLKLVGSDLTQLLQVQIYLKDLADAPILNELWDAWIPEGHAPSRACVQAALGNPAMRVEMVLTAAVQS